MSTVNVPGRRPSPKLCAWVGIVGLAACSSTGPAAREPGAGGDDVPPVTAGAGGSGGDDGTAGDAVGGDAGTPEASGAAGVGGGSDEAGAGGASAGTSEDAGAASPEAGIIGTSCSGGGTGFTVMGDIVRDNATCLMWDRDHVALGFQESQQHCHDSRLGGYVDWRMPTAQELFSLVRKGDAINIDTTAFPNPPGSCWSATQPDAMHSCAVGFDSGGCYKYGNSAGTWGTYCVRGSSSTLPAISASCKTVCGL
jgi:hypothetical protein